MKYIHTYISTKGYVNSLTVGVISLREKDKQLIIEKQKKTKAYDRFS